MYDQKAIFILVLVCELFLKFHHRKRNCGARGEGKIKNKLVPSSRGISAKKIIQTQSLASRVW